MTLNDGKNTMPSNEENVGLLEEPSISEFDSEQIIDDYESFHHVRSTLRTTLRHYYGCSSALAVPWKALLATPRRALFFRVAVFFLPSFLQGRLAGERINPPKLTHTSYLDGMRGVACLMVFFCHYSFQAFYISQTWGTGENNYSILRLPIIRLFYQGPAAVCVFFVISGYALSYRPLKLIRSGATADFATTMSSLTFRRAIRLFLPVACSSLMIAIFLQIGVFEWAREFAKDRTYMKNIAEPLPQVMPTVYAQLKDYVHQMYRMFYILNWTEFEKNDVYDLHLWSIPIEYRCSLWLFLIIIGTARLRTGFRFLTVSIILYFVYLQSRWELWLFICGMLIAEMDHIRGAHVPPSSLPQREKEPTEAHSRLKGLFWGALSVLGLYLLSEPDDAGWEAPGWVFLTSLIPKWWTELHFRYWQSFGAVVFVFAVGHCRRWRSFFDAAVIQYLGRISFALYLMHGPILHTFGYQWEKMAYAVTGVEGYWFNAGFMLGSIFVIPTIIWWADVFWRAVDIPSVRFSKWLESKLIKERSGESVVVGGGGGGRG